MAVMYFCLHIQLELFLLGLALKDTILCSV